MTTIFNICYACL